MATIVIKDLAENTALDRDAMRAVLGGSRLRGPNGGQSRLRPTRLVDLRTRAGRQARSTGGQPA